jgi:hypothetical protein
MRPLTSPSSTNGDLLARALASATQEGYLPDELEATDAPPPARRAAAPEEPRPWHPDLNPTQQRIFDDPALNILGYGEKGSGKSIAFGHKLVRHAYENDNALVLIIAPSMRTGNEGIWYDLETLILPAWREGNRDKEGNLIDHGIGLEYTAQKLDPNTKDRHRWIRNRFGGWSKLLLMSIPFAAQVQARVKGPAPSMVYVDELTNCSAREYFTYPAAQLGRRRGILGPQQFCASCNPEGPSHWVYQVFFVECMDQESGARDKDFSVYHVPVTENLHRLPDGYVQRLEKTFKADPIELRRLLAGEWVDRPTGEGLFKEYFVPALHLKGDLVKGLGLLPVPGFPIVIGYDLGQVYSSITFLQQVFTRDRSVWIAFDECDHLGQKILYKTLAWEVIERMKYWQSVKLPGSAGRPFPFQFIHVTDESAINQWHPNGQGSYDAWDFEREYNRVAQKELANRSMRLLGCPKGSGSVAARVRLLQGKLYTEEFLVSALCRNVKDMLLCLEADKEDPEKPRRSRFLHKFDSTTYPIFKFEFAAGGRNVPPGQELSPALIRCGCN